MRARKLKLIKQHPNQLSWNYSCNKRELEESATFYANYLLISPNLPRNYRKSTVFIIVFENNEAEKPNIQILSAILSTLQNSM